MRQSVSALGPAATPDAARLDAMAARQVGITDKWKNSPSGLSAMGFKRVSRGPVPPNVDLQDMAAERKRGK